MADIIIETTSKNITIAPKNNNLKLEQLNTLYAQSVEFSNKLQKIFKFQEQPVLPGESSLAKFSVSEFTSTSNPKLVKQQPTEQEVAYLASKIAKKFNFEYRHGPGKYDQPMETERTKNIPIS